MHEAGSEKAGAACDRGLGWLGKNQVLDAPRDWQRDRPWLKGGGWAFQFENAHYPDLDDTAVVAFAMVTTDDHGEHLERARRAADWICGMQSSNGGFAAFDVDNNFTYLNEIPFADHGALLDPPTSDVSARCLMLLSQLPDPQPYHIKAAKACLAYLFREQEPDGSWYGRWGTNYVYGTWSVLIALEQAGVPADTPQIRRAVEWLKSVQREDGGWGEGNDTYYPGVAHGGGPKSTSFQTAWALLGLMAAGEGDSPAVHRGIHYLLRTQRPDGLWDDADFTSPGFPRVFYLRYHGYEKYFPLWALSRYRSLAAARTP
jgi:squalene-hopene/tetraprenyl-beta-curcumene cyclase